MPRSIATTPLHGSAGTASGPIGDALLNQRVMAGIGNVFKAEILFLAKIDPFTPVADLDDDAIRRIIEIAVAQLRANVAPRERTLAPARGRRTTGSLHPSKGLWVYRPRRPPLPHLRDFNRGEKDRTRCAPHVLVSELPGQRGHRGFEHLRIDELISHTFSNFYRCTPGASWPVRATYST